MRENDRSNVFILLDSRWNGSNHDENYEQIGVEDIPVRCSREHEGSLLGQIEVEREIVEYPEDNQIIQIGSPRVLLPGEGQRRTSSSRCFTFDCT